MFYGFLHLRGAFQVFYVLIILEAILVFTGGSKIIFTNM